MTGIVATAHIDVDVAPEEVWSALTEPARIKEYMFGSDVESNWEPGSPITWSGEFNGKPYQDKGEILTVEPAKKLEMTHFSAMSGAEDRPENYHRLTYLLEPRGEGTHIELRQDNNPDDEAAKHSQENWEMMLAGLKKHLEGSSR
jgi:uncharacterized protein YndB with AHSA1/START domain